MKNRTAWGIFLLIIGIAVICGLTGIIDADILENLAPALLSLAAILFCVVNRRVNIFFVIMFLLGVYLTLNNFDIYKLSDDNWGLFWAGVLVVVAVSLIIPRRPHKPIVITASDENGATAVFSGVQGQAKAGVNNYALTAIFGGGELNLANAVDLQGSCVVNATVIFGGGDIIVPDDWAIDTNDLVAIFGGYESSKMQPASVNGVVRVSGIVLFGGLDIRRASEHKKH